MDTRSEIREFLTSRRAKITPDQAGLRAYGGRRVPGLRREEVAVPAGVSVPYDTRPERGDMSGVSERLLEALARALALDEAERAHVFDLARAAQPTSSPRRRRQTRQRVRPSIRLILDAMTGAAAFVRNGRLDVLAANRSAAPCTPRCPSRPTARSTPPASSSSTRGPPRSTATGTAPRPDASPSCALQPAATLRPRPLRPGRRALHQSEELCTRWAAHDVRFDDICVKHFRHPAIGDLSLSFDRLDVAADPGPTIFASAAEPGSRSEKALKLLGSWAATLDQTETAQAADNV